MNIESARRPILPRAKLPWPTTNDPSAPQLWLGNVSYFHWFFPGHGHDHDTQAVASPVQKTVPSNPS